MFCKYALTRAGFQRLLDASPDMEVVAETDSLKKTEQLVQKLRPDVILLECVDPVRAAIALVSELTSMSRKTPIVLVTVHDDPRFVRTMLRAGVMGFIVKHSSDAELLLAVRYASRRQKFLDPNLIDAATAEAAASHSRGKQVLSKREIQVLRRLVQGYTNQQIAQELSLSVKTVETYRARIYQKLELHNRADLMRYAVAVGLISVNDQQAQDWAGT